MTTTPQPTPAELAIMFHDTYERLAPSFGYETRTETRKFDPTTPNGRLMISVCGEILSTLAAHRPTAEPTLAPIAKRLAQALETLISLNGFFFAGDDKEREVIAMSVVRQIARTALKDVPPADPAQAHAAELERELRIAVYGGMIRTSALTLLVQLDTERKAQAQAEHERPLP